MELTQRLEQCQQVSTISKFKICLLFCLFFLTACDPGDSKLLVINNSDYELILDYNESGGENLSILPPYPIDDNGKAVINSEYVASDESDFIMPHSKKNIHIFGTWESKFYSSKSISFFLLNADVLKNHNWQEIRRSNSYLRKYIMTKNDMEKHNWTIVFN